MVLSCQSLCHSYKQGERVIPILDQISLRIQPGEIVALVGSSGSGKSTLLHLLGLLDQADSGSITIQNQTFEYPFVKESQQNRCRQSSIGFIYQFHHLISSLTAGENVALPLMLDGKTQKESLHVAVDILSQIKMEHRFDHLPSQLSGGEQQRVAIARALIRKPFIILADEPTGNLDNETAEIVFQEMLMLIRQNQTAALIATHDLALAHKMDRILYLSHQKLSETPPISSLS